MFSEITISSEKLLAVTLSNRTDYTENNSYVGFLPSSIDPAPPIIYSVNIPSSLNYDTDFIVNLFVNDESGIGSVIAEFNDQTYELLDDGAHNDSLAGDNIYGAEIPVFHHQNQILHPL
ncbi:MAG: hypothetical protein U5K00_17830 [Melioribacteraceae bacterium]|nr:hypothetical protein [Melioribacteraceae bacterium]